jgi:hypothetical protein
MVVPEPFDEEGDTRSHDCIVPKGSADFSVMTNRQDGLIGD